MRFKDSGLQPLILLKKENLVNVFSSEVLNILIQRAPVKFAYISYYYHGFKKISVIKQCGQASRSMPAYGQKQR